VFAVFPRKASITLAHGFVVLKLTTPIAITDGAILVLGAGLGAGGTCIVLLALAASSTVGGGEGAFSVPTT
jgi:hypothetical protein